MTAVEAQGVFDEYVKAVGDGDYPTQAGILTSLLRICVLQGDTVAGEIARATAKSILLYRELEVKK